MTTALLDAPIRDIAAEYSELTDQLIQARQIRDGSSWMLGDLLQGVEGRYGEMTMENIARDIGVSPQSCYEWAVMSSVYKRAVREHYARKKLSYSHLRLAYRQSQDKSQMYEFLNLMAREKWSVAQAAVELKKLRGAPVPPVTLNALVTFRRVGNVLVCEGEGLEEIEEGVLMKVKMVRVQ